MFKLEILKARVQSLNRTSPKFNNYLHTKIIIYKKYIFTLNTPPPSTLHSLLYKVPDCNTKLLNRIQCTTISYPTKVEPILSQTFHKT